MKNICAKVLLTLSILTASSLSAYYNQDCCECMDGFDFYIGGNLGALTHLSLRNDLDGFLVDNSGWSTNNTAFTGGVQGGIDKRFCNALIGIVGDWNATDSSSKIHEDPNGATPNLIHSKMDWIATIRARAGLAVGNALVYVTGGAANAKFKTRWFDEPTTFNHSHSHWGWVGGAGTEFRLGCNVGIGAEILGAHFDNDTKRFEDPNNLGTFFSFGHNDTVWLGRVMINYHFGSPGSFFRR